MATRHQLICCPITFPYNFCLVPVLPIYAIWEILSTLWKICYYSNYMLLINFFPYFMYYISPLCSCRPHWPQDWVSFARWEDASQDLSDPHQEDDTSRRPGPGRVHHCQGWPFWSWYQGKHFKGVSVPIIKISKFISPATLYACMTTFFNL